MIFLVEGIHRTMAAPRKYPDELREREVRLVQESGRPIAHVADDLGVHREALRGWVRRAEADRGARSDLLSAAEREELMSIPVTVPVPVLAINPVASAVKVAKPGAVNTHRRFSSTADNDAGNVGDRTIGGPLPRGEHQHRRCFSRARGNQLATTANRRIGRNRSGLRKPRNPSQGRNGH